MNNESKPAVESPEHQAYAALTPATIIDAIETTGRLCDGRLLALNSYENRVYRVGIEDGAPVVAKFYRPGRWSDEAILEEHGYTSELAAAEIPVVAPLADAGGRTLYHHGYYRFAIYPSRGGRAPDIDDPEQLEQLGRFIGRIHALGRVRPFRHRPALDIETFGEAPRDWLLRHGWLPAHLEEAYATLTADLLRAVAACYARAGAVEKLRLHGDLHIGNILWTDAGPHIVDFDDARSGPAVQDLWMLLAGDRGNMTARLADLLDGYTRFADFNAAELHLVEALRTLRMLHHSAWLAQRWEDPAFPLAFPWFNTTRYWEDQVLALREQAALLQEPALVWS